MPTEPTSAPTPSEGRTITKKDLVERIADDTGMRRTQVKDALQLFLTAITDELAAGNRLEFRDFGVFEPVARRARRAQNPKTLAPVTVPPKRAVRFKPGRLLKAKMEG
jgi:nucleoid DNA-binding protein